MKIPEQVLCVLIFLIWYSHVFAQQETSSTSMVCLGEKVRMKISEFTRKYFCNSFLTTKPKKVFFQCQPWRIPYIEGNFQRAILQNILLNEIILNQCKQLQETLLDTS